jgi:hypothetical protein
MFTEKEENSFIISCPHCSMMCEILELNCRVFRCGVYKNTLIQINPHMSKKDCEELKNNDEIYGCGKPFSIDGSFENPDVKKCNYI